MEISIKETPKITETTCNPECPACFAKRRHLETDWMLFHPDRGKGFSKEHGSPPDQPSEKE